MSRVLVSLTHEGAPTPMVSGPHPDVWITARIPLADLKDAREGVDRLQATIEALSGASLLVLSEEQRSFLALDLDKPFSHGWVWERQSGQTVATALLCAALMHAVPNCIVDVGSKDPSEKRIIVEEAGKLLKTAYPDAPLHRNWSGGYTDVDTVKDSRGICLEPDEERAAL